jgi:tetratricopeptide (TPR) repeat protein
MKKALVILGLIISGSGFAQSLKDAIRLTVNEQYDEATQLFQQLIQREPANASNYYYFGDNYIQQDNLDSAKIIFEKGDKVDSKNPLNKIGLGTVMLYEAKVAEANTKAEKAGQAYQSLKSSYENSLNKTEQARIEVEVALTNWEKAKTEAEREKVKVEEAKVNFDKALVIAGTKNSVAYIELAKALTVSPNKDLAKAMEYIDKAIVLDPRSVEAYIVKGDLFTEQNQGTPAAENYNKALDLDKISLKALLRKAILYRRTTSYDVAIATLEEASKTDPSFAPAYREMAENYFAKRTKDGLAKAIDFYNRYLTLSKNNFSARLRYAQFLFLAKEYQKALTEVIQLTQLKTDNIYAQRIKAYSSLETGDYKTTKATLDVLFQKIDKSKIVQKDLEYYGKSLAKTEQDSLANIYYRQAFDMDTNRVDLLKEIADAFYKMKKYHEAAAVYREKINTGLNVMANDYKQLGQSYFFEAQNQKADSALALFRQADSAFAKLNEMSPKWASGYMWRAKANSMIDPTSAQGLAKPFYEKYIELASADSVNAAKYRDGLIESYEYLGNYYALKNEFSNTEEFMKKILGIDATNKKALDVLEVIRKMREGKKAPQK